MKAEMTTAAEHTPGPWRWHDELILAGGNGRIGLRVIAEAPGGFHFETDAEKEANARLIAAAPDLLAACRAMIRLHYDEGKPSVDGLEAIRKAEAAIGRAKGQKP